MCEDISTLCSLCKTDLSGTPVWQEDWNYDPTGNWRGATSAYVTKVNGSTTLDQNRTHDKANEILTLTGTPDWVDPTHDAAGNTTQVPQPATPTSSYDGKFDAWDRLVEVKVTGGAVVATYRYDGLKRRVTKVAGGNTRHYYYSNRWQVLEERLNALTTADRQFVWGVRHVDDPIERDRGSERFYVLHDHLSVTALVSTAGAVQERYGYDGFGPQRVLDASFGARAASLYDWETGFGAYRLDTESGLCQVRHRFYHPKLGRWTGRDPVQRQSSHLYAYARQHPTDLRDPLGLWTKADWDQCVKTHISPPDAKIIQKCFKECACKIGEESFWECFKNCLKNKGKSYALDSFVAVFCCLRFADERSISPNADPCTVAKEKKSIDWCTLCCDFKACISDLKGTSPTAVKEQLEACYCKCL